MAHISTREQIAQLLRIHGPLTSADLVGFLDITPTAIRQHLDRLVAEGLVETVGLRRGRGRPRKVYALADKADRLFPHSYDALAMDLLEAIARLPEGAQLLHQVLAARREIWSERYARRFAGKPLGKQVAEAAALFNEKGGLTEYAARPDGTYILTKRNCNISTVSAQHAEFCEEERAWLEEVLQTPVESTHSRAAGDAACEFCIRPAEAVAAKQNPRAVQGG